MEKTGQFRHRANPAGTLAHPQRSLPTPTRPTDANLNSTTGLTPLLAAVVSNQPAIVEVRSKGGFTLRCRQGVPAETVWVWILSLGRAGPGERPAALRGTACCPAVPCSPRVSQP